MEISRGRLVVAHVLVFYVNEETAARPGGGIEKLVWNGVLPGCKHGVLKPSTCMAAVFPSGRGMISPPVCTSTLSWFACSISPVSCDRVANGVS